MIGRFLAPPTMAAWRHRDAREGFEVAFLRAAEDGLRLQGHASAVEAGQAWAISYDIAVDSVWTTRGARVVGHSMDGGAT